MAMFEMTPDQVVEWRQKQGDMVALHVNGEKATLVGVGVKDDPLSQELIGVLQGAAPTSV